MLMLAEKFPGVTTWPRWIEPKVDGWRFQIIVEGRGARVVQRSGRDYTERLGFIARQIRAAVRREIPRGRVVVDGEMSAGSWAATTSCCSTARPMDRSALVFYVFDLIDARSRPLHERKDRLARIVEDAREQGAGNISLVPHVVCGGPGQADDTYRIFLRHGFEGAVLKDPDGLYRDGRSSAWQKIKPWQTAEGRVISVERGERPVGALVLRLPDGTEVRVGSGMTDDVREDPEVIGRTVEFRYQAADDHRYRHPVFHRYRVDVEAT